MCGMMDEMVDRALKVRADYFNDLNAVINGLTKITREKLAGTLHGSLMVITTPGKLITADRLPPEGTYVIYCGKRHYFTRFLEDEEDILRLCPEDHDTDVPELQPVCEMVEAYYAMIESHGLVPDHRINVPCIFVDAYPEYMTKRS